MPNLFKSTKKLRSKSNAIKLLNVSFIEKFSNAFIGSLAVLDQESPPSLLE